MTLTLARRPRLIAGAALFTAAALAVAGWTLAPRGAEESERAGPRLAIDVVAPVEPEVDPGSILEVGALNDGFDRAVLDRQPETDDPTWLPADAYAGETWPPLDPPRMPAPTPIAYADPPPEPMPHPLADGSRSFGFDRLRSAIEADESRLEWTAPLPPSAAPTSNYTQPSEYSSE